MRCRSIPNSRLFHAVLVGGGLVVTGMIRAHPEIEDAVRSVNAEIAAAPENAALYLTRGEIYARHGEWVVADANYQRAAELDPASPRLMRAQGALELATGNAASALTFLDRAIAADPRDPTALVLRSRARIARQERDAAIADLDAAIALIVAPAPELFLERAALLAPAEAIRSLDAAVAQIGPVVSLLLPIVALEESIGRIDAAAARLEQLAAQSERKEIWLKRRGDLLARAGQSHSAQTAYAAARVAIGELPAWLQNSPDTIELSRELARLTDSGS